VLFTSIEFAFFFIIVLAIYWTIQGRLSAQNLLLLVASYIFYGVWDPRFLFLIVISTVVDYSCALMVDKGKISQKHRLVASLFLVISAFLFVVFQFNAIDVQNVGFKFAVNIDWNNLFSDSFGWIVLAISIAFVILANMLYPKFIQMDEIFRRKFFMITSISSNLIILGFFKYFNFFAESFTSMSESIFGISPAWYTLDIILPVGISFYTFQTMSYTIDVYRREMKATTNMLNFAAYVSFFPQLVAGPIERGKQLLPQFERTRSKITLEDFRLGCWLIAWGLFKKLVIADNVALVANNTFAPYDAMTNEAVTAPDDGLRLLIALYAFAIQIYCDFSGYTDIARGTAKLLGFNLMINFRLPYFATDPSSFWRRWHISLSTWLRDYLYISLGGNRGSSLQTHRNLFLTMLLGGLWHGAAWTFIIWGAYQGALLSIYRALGVDAERGNYTRWKKFFMIIFFFQLTCIGWLIFRAQNVETIGIFLQSIFLSPFGSLEAWENFKTLLYYSWFLIIFQIIQHKTNNLNPMENWHWFIKLNIWIYIIMSLLVLASPGGQEFIYFAF